MTKKLISFFTALFLMCLNFPNLLALNFYNENLNSNSVYMVDYNSGISIVEKNIDERRSPASLTKIVTFLVTYENSSNRDETKVKVSKEVLDMVDPESSGAKLKEGEEYSITDLLHCMMICSSGYCAMVLADYIGGGSIEKFVEMMNSKVKELGCNDTNFENPDGIHSENQYTTARDMYKITKYAMENKDFLDIVGKTEYSMFGDERDPIVTTNHMMDKKRGGKYYMPFIKGIKTGYTENAGRCLISYASKDDKNYVTVVMGGPTKNDKGEALTENSAMLDSFNLYNWAFENLRQMSICEKYSPLTQIDLKLAWGRDKLILSPEKDISVVLPKNIKKEEITFDYEIPEHIDAPVKKDEIIGKANLLYGGEKILSFNLVSPEKIDANYALVIFNFLDSIFSSKIFLVLFVLFLILLVLYAALVLRYNIIKNKKRKVVDIKRFKK